MIELAKMSGLKESETRRHNPSAQGPVIMDVNYDRRISLNEVEMEAMFRRN